MKLAGAVLWAVGIVLFIYSAFFFDPSVRSYAGGYGPDRIVNFDLQQRQLLLGLCGLAMFATGVTLHALGYIAELISSSPEQVSKRPPERHQDALARTGHAQSYADAEMMARHGIVPGDDGARV